MLTTHTQGIYKKEKYERGYRSIDMVHLFSFKTNPPPHLEKTSKTFGGKLRSISHNNERPGERNQAISLAKKRTRLITQFIRPSGSFNIISTEGNK